MIFKKFSADFDLNEIVFWNKEMLKLIAHLSAHCHEEMIPLHLTSGMRSKYDGISTSDTHQEGRAVDIRVKYLNKIQLQSILRFLSGYDHLEKVGAISKSDGTRRIAYVESDHIHLQVTR